MMQVPRVRYICYNNPLIIAQTFGGIFIYIFIFISTPLLYTHTHTHTHPHTHIHTHTHIYNIHLYTARTMYLLEDLISFPLVTVVHLYIYIVYYNKRPLVPNIYRGAVLTYYDIV
jgi:hypothetical protein